MDANTSLSVLCYRAELADTTTSSLTPCVFCFLGIFLYILWFVGPFMLASVSEYMYTFCGVAQNGRGLSIGCGVYVMRVLDILPDGNVVVEAAHLYRVVSPDQQIVGELIKEDELETVISAYRCCCRTGEPDAIAIRYADLAAQAASS